MRFAPRIPIELLVVLVRLDDGRLSAAELCRRVGTEAERLGLTRPSYQRLRELLHEVRALRKWQSANARVNVFVRARRRRRFFLGRPGWTVRASMEPAKPSNTVLLGRSAGKV